MKKIFGIGDKAGGLIVVEQAVAAATLRNPLIHQANLESARLSLKWNGLK